MIEFSIGDIEFALILVCSVLFVIFCGYFINKYRKTEEKTQAWFYLGLGVFCLCFAIMRIWFLCSDLVDEGLWGVSQIGPIILDADFYWRWAAIFGIGAVLSVLFVIERYMVKTHYILSFITSIGVVIALIVPVEPYGRLATYVFTPFGVLAVVGLYAYLIKITPGRIRIKTILAMIGIFLIFFGFIVDTDLGQSILATLDIEVVGIIASSLMMVGGAIFVLGYRIE